MWTNNSDFKHMTEERHTKPGSASINWDPKKKTGDQSIKHREAENKPQISSPILQSNEVNFKQN